jgi:glyoxylase-like metal-dependent hydrolase (beta-lactamase superfamily II)
MQEPVSRSTRPRRWLVGGLTLLVLAAALLAGYRWRSTGNDIAPPPLPPAQIPVLSPYPMTIVPGVHLLGGLAPAAAYVVETSEGLALVDTGLDRDAGPLKGEMDQLKLDWRRVRAIFLTHVHGDHCGGAEYLRKATGAKVYAGRGDAAVLRVGRPREAFFSTFYMPGVPTPGPTTVDVELAGSETIELGDTRFRVVAAPGHTPGSVCYLMERGGKRMLFSGDVIWSLSGDETTRATVGWPLGTYAAYLAPRYRGDAEGFLTTLRRLRALPAPDLVLPGHPRNDQPPRSPALSKHRWLGLLDMGIREMERLQARYARDGANFLDGVPKRLLPGLYYLGDLQGMAVYAFIASSKLFVVGAPGGPGLADFLGERLRRLGLKPTAPAAVLLTSGDAEETAGLAKLVEKYHAQVVASPAAWQKINGACPAGTGFVPAEELPAKGWFPAQVVPLGGRGVGPVAYLLPWAGKSVLFSGRIPIKPSGSAPEELLADLTQGRASAADYRAALGRLAKLRPDLWLPARPADCQNANLYDGEWQELIANNEKLLP